ncbi:hypothetical protein AVEN_241162-1 [Araneus ventricosus]|uniref:Uncharacterized protein n=1 Tax=Araneus ventricosus TaxID=182803 RepID=A0A4Y2FZH2_ARAVE|nr:hypothetical protein AVEN_241162-1 [Araneus ventricosus]
MTSGLFANLSRWKLTTQSTQRNDSFREKVLGLLNSIDTGPSHTSLQAKDDSRPNVTLKFPPLSLSVIDFTVLSSLEWLAQMCLGKRVVFSQFGQC